MTNKNTRSFFANYICSVCFETTDLLTGRYTNWISFSPMLALGLMGTNTDKFGKKIAPESRILTWSCPNLNQFFLQLYCKYQTNKQTNLVILQKSWKVITWQISNNKKKAFNLRQFTCIKSLIQYFPKCEMISYIYGPIFKYQEMYEPQTLYIQNLEASGTYFCSILLFHFYEFCHMGILLLLSWA